MASPVVAVLRDGEVTTIRPEAVVLGDTVVLRAGDQIVADGLVDEEVDLTINESLLTGESEPVEKNVGRQGALGIAGRIRRRAGHGHRGRCLVLREQAHRGDQAALAGPVRAADGRPTSILVYISWIVGPIALLVIGSRILAYGQGLDLSVLSLQDWRGLIVDVVASIVGMIPEGLVLLDQPGVRGGGDPAGGPEGAHPGTRRGRDPGESGCAVPGQDRHPHQRHGLVHRQTEPLREDPAMAAALSLLRARRGCERHSARAGRTRSQRSARSCVQRVPFASKRQCSGA